MSDRIEITLDGVTVEAVLRVQAAPKTVEAIQKSLPFTTRATHSSWSGECIWLASENPPRVAPENSTLFISQGDVLLTSKGEIVIAYGRKCISRGSGGDNPSNAFAMVRDLDAMDRFAEVCRRVLSEGAKTVTVKLKK